MIQGTILYNIPHTIVGFPATMKDKTKKVLKFIIFIAVALLLVYFLEGWGMLGLLIFIIVISLRRMWKLREVFKTSIKQIETMVFGKPLDKDAWKKGEMKNTKVEITWGKESKLKWEEYVGILFYPSLLLLFLGFAFNKPYLIYTAGVLTLVWIWGTIKRRYKNESRNTT